MQKQLKSAGQKLNPQYVRVWKSASMKAIEEILGLNNLDAMILSSYESLLEKASKSDDLKHSLQKILQLQEESIEERYR